MTVRIKVDKSLQEVLEDIRKNVAGSLRKQYGLNEITIYGPVASQILAAQSRGMKSMNFKIRKVGLNKGILELIG